MKILTIGDVHGRNLWKNAGDINELLLADFQPEYDKYVFLGDYCDSFTKSNVEIIHNLKEIIEFKKRYNDNVILLWGNHEMHYLTTNKKHQCSGFRGTMWFDLNEIFRENYKLFQLAYQHNNYLFTHAGVHKGWYKFKFKEYDTQKTLADSLNFQFERNLDILFDVGFMRGGLNKVGGPLWLDKEHGCRKPLDGYHQIVGHTHTKKIITCRKDKNTTITFCDNQPENESIFNNIFYTITTI